VRQGVREGGAPDSKSQEIDRQMALIFSEFKSVGWSVEPGFERNRPAALGGSATNHTSSVLLDRGRGGATLPDPYRNLLLPSGVSPPIAAFDPHLSPPCPGEGRSKGELGVCRA